MFDDIGKQLNQQREQNNSYQHDKNPPQQEAPAKGTIRMNKQKENEILQTSKQKDNQSSSINKQKDNETKVTATFNYEKSMKNKEQPSQKSDGGNFDNERKYDMPSSSNKNQNLQNDAALVNSSRPGGVSSNSTSVDAPTLKPALSSNSKKNTKGEGSNNSTSSLSKLTPRRNFFKERRSQIANELQNWDKNRESVQPSIDTEKGKSSECNQSVQSTDKNQLQEASVVQNPRDNAGQPKQEKTLSLEGGSQYNQDGNKKGSQPKSHNLMHQTSD